MRSWFFLRSRFAYKGLEKVVQAPMEKHLNWYDKEYMKMAMLKHEETFREQVYELHRLYQIQKLLMKNIAKGKQGQELGIRNFTNANSSNQINDHHEIHKRHQPAEEYVAGKDGHGIRQIEDESELELTLGLASQRRRKRTSEAPLPSDSAASFSSSSTGSSHIKRSNSLCHIRTNTREELTSRRWGLDMASSNPGFLGGSKNSSHDVEEQFRQDRHSNPPWLFQALSLKTT